MPFLADTLPPPVQKPTVVLVHGLGRTSRSMRPLEVEATRRGYRVVNFGYASTRGTVEAHADSLAARLAREVPEGPLYVVTHSLGGIVLRYAVASGKVHASRVAGAVLLAPPNAGSEVADAFSQAPGLRWIGNPGMGPALRQLSTDSASLVYRLPPVNFPVGVIAGTRTLNPAFSWLIPGPDDGKVSVDNAKVPGMRAFIAMPHTHTFIMRSPAVARQAFAFLEHGAFEPER